MRIILLFALFLFLLSCSHYNCSISVKSNKKKFKNSLAVIEKGEEGNRYVLIEKYREAINFLSLVTGIDSKADYSSTFGYRNTGDYKSDMEQWKKMV
jgi:hypothetical protein